jgi:hypothetical protein
MSDSNRGKVIRRWRPELLEAGSKEYEASRLESILKHERGLLGNDEIAELQQNSMWLRHEGRKLRKKAEINEVSESLTSFRSRRGHRN